MVFPQEELALEYLKAKREIPEVSSDFANGTVYIDDGETYAFKNGDFAYWAVIFKREHDYLHTIINKNLDKKGSLKSEIRIETIIIRGAKFYPRTAHIYLDGKHLKSISPKIFIPRVSVQLNENEAQPKSIMATMCRNT
ncbi:unnamed protein product [Haemonchus placei]|uniref:Conserved domain protein n=1 Tax=Haemonchus placei TaxID=6290 RepID=A0A0N4W705_HAEPC|nr:unnamed protein product [Haemonchus placei]